MRPLGGVIFGFIGDRFGRATVLKMSILTMGTATFLIGVLPTAAVAGTWAAVLLVAVRLLQGLSVGGEFSGSVTYMVETAPSAHRGFTGSWANFGSLAGTMIGSGLAALLTTVLDTTAVHSWGWRLPFLLGGVFGAIAYLYVRNLHETPHMDHHENVHQEDSPLREAITRNRRETLLAIVFTSGYGVFFYIPLVYLPTYVSQFGSISNHVALQLNALGILVAMPMIPLCGSISDHVFRRKTMLLFAFLAAAVLGWPLLILATQSLIKLLIAQIVFSLLIAIPLGVAPAMLVELFPVADRLTGYSVAYNIGLGIAGGTAPMIATWLISSTGHPSAPGVYLALTALLSAGGLALMPDRSREPLQ